MLGYLDKRCNDALGIMAGFINFTAGMTPLDWSVPLLGQTEYKRYPF
jgi:hypothetical protein